MGGTHQNASPDDGSGNKGLAELNRDTRHEHKEVRHGIAGDGQGLSEEDESRINDSAIDANDDPCGEEAALAHQSGLLKQQLSAPIVRWERFLPVRTLKVLLVENDDSTRQVVCALLRNCSYEVTAAANGMEAWKVLEDLTNHIDLVLTEVVMPYLSGIGLLCKIMSHKTCKNIPVIMMSSNDAMGIVFKCLSKGAVDFLVKPIRKNELKNLWQHVWRRCHSSSGSGSESGIQNQKSTKSKNENDSDNNTGSNDDEDNGSFGLNAGDGSDNGSGTQSSWTKRAVEVDSPQPISSSEQLSCTHDSTCAQVIYPKPETFCSNKVKVNTNINDSKAFDDIICKNLEVCPLRNTARNESYQADKAPTKLIDPSTKKMPESGSNNVDLVGNMKGNALHEPSTEAIDLLGGIAKNKPQPIVAMSDTSKTFPNISENKEKESFVELPFLELSLKRLRSTGEAGMSASDERNVLKRSNLSAFSRYPSSIASVQAPTGYGGNSVVDNCSVAAPLKQGSNGNSNNNDMGSTNKNVVTKPGVYKGVSSSAIKCNHTASAFHPVQPQNSTVSQVVQEKINEASKVSVIGQSRDPQNQVQVQQLHHHHYHHHHHNHAHGLRAQPDEDLSLENLKATAAYCSSSNAFATPPEANAANYSLHGSNSGSNHGSDGQKNGVPCGNDSGSGSGADQNRSAQREAALNKFRQKRKARNFGKKVRYQSRKRLAEQRPRVRGQFVRRVVQSDETGGRHEVFN